MDERIVVYIDRDTFRMDGSCDVQYPSMGKESKTYHCSDVFNMLDHKQLYDAFAREVTIEISKYIFSIYCDWEQKE